jgi:crotonobetainyl-CoA:carnitine CoA-transferase CaiB-like acyl-CoA transferase
LTDRPLSGLRVIEVGQLLAGPFASTILGYFGAEVIKIEQPIKGDPIRGWRHVVDGTSLWWSSLARNKKCITLDISKKEGQKILVNLLEQADILVENFKPGVMEKWGFSNSSIEKINKKIIYARISGYGQTGPYAGKAGFASVCEAFGGLRFVNGVPGEPPVRPNLSIGDTLAGIHAALGILLAIIQRQKDGSGQVIDVAIFEAIFNLLEAVVPEYSGAGIIRQPSGTTITGIVPTNTYLCADNVHIVIGANTNPMFKRLAQLIGRDDMASDPELEENSGRVKHQKKVDFAIEEWTKQIPSKTALSKLDAASVAAGPIFSVEDMFNDEQYEHRKLLETVSINGKHLKIPAIIPKLSRTPGKTTHPGTTLGEYNQEIYKNLLNMNPDELKELEEKKII